MSKRKAQIRWNEYVLNLLPSKRLKHETARQNKNLDNKYKMGVKK